MPLRSTYLRIVTISATVPSDQLSLMPEFGIGFGMADFRRFYAICGSGSKGKLCNG
jgi:hypothetical protein